MGDESKKKKSGTFALPKTVAEKATPPEKPVDPVFGLEQSFSNCVEQLKVWGLEAHIIKYLYVYLLVF